NSRFLLSPTLPNEPIDYPDSQLGCWTRRSRISPSPKIPIRRCFCRYPGTQAAHRLLVLRGWSPPRYLGFCPLRPPERHPPRKRSPPPPIPPRSQNLPQQRPAVAECHRIVRLNLARVHRVYGQACALLLVCALFLI